MLTCDGRAAAQTISSAISSAVTKVHRRTISVGAVGNGEHKHTWVLDIVHLVRRGLISTETYDGEFSLTIPTMGGINRKESHRQE